MGLNGNLSDKQIRATIYGTLIVCAALVYPVGKTLWDIADYVNSAENERAENRSKTQLALNILDDRKVPVGMVPVMETRINHLESTVDKIDDQIGDMQTQQNNIFDILINAHPVQASEVLKK